MQAGLRWTLWAEKKTKALWHFKSKKKNNGTNQCRNHFLTSYEVPSQKYFFGLSLFTSTMHAEFVLCTRKYIDFAISVLFANTYNCLLTYLNKQG